MNTGMTVSRDSIDRFRSFMCANGAPENTVRAYGSDLMGLLEWSGLPEIPAASLESTAAKYLNTMRKVWAPKTTNRKLGTFRSFGKWGGDPILVLYKAPKAAEAEPHPLPEGIDGVLAMLAACEPWDAHHRALVALTGLCGLRVGEAISITPANIDAGARRLRFRGKGDKERFVPISAKAWEYIEPAMRVAAKRDGRPLVAMQDRWARELLKTLALRAGLSRDVCSHDMRATFATAAYTKTKDIRAVQMILGHANVTQTELYTGVSGEAMRDATELV